MGSAFAMWAYHRRLSMDLQEKQNSENTDPDPRIEVAHAERQNKKKRSESESSEALERRESIDNEETSDDESKPAGQAHGHNSKRRFSLDFLFGKKGKKKERKQKRSESLATENSEDYNNVKELRYPGIADNDFSRFYFI